jgi:DNA-binding NtrC family response regulator
MAHTVLIIDDEKSIRTALREILEMEKIKVEEAQDGKEGFNLLSAKKYDCALCDIKMPRMNGMEVLTKAKENGIDTPIIMISGHGTTDDAVEAVRKGAFDYIAKPPDLNRLLITVRNAIDHENLVTNNKQLKRKINGVQEIVGESEEIVKVKETIDKVAPTDARVLILGDNGTGKELIARWLHEKSERNSGPLIEVNCAAIPSELIESELFGHEKGSFTGAVRQSIGKFEQANGGTLFLDEIGDMSADAQAKVLRALQEGKINRIGGDKEIEVNVRVIAATNKNLQAEIEKETFRKDLYFRLGVIVIEVPTLNERTSDIPLLVDYFLDHICEEQGKKRISITPDAVESLCKKDWQGNIRELSNIVQRLVIFADNEITIETVNAHVQ